MDSRGDGGKYRCGMCFRDRVDRTSCTGCGAQRKEKMMLMYLARATERIVVHFNGMKRICGGADLGVCTLQVFLW